ncbi:MAG: TIM barrel protein [Opitutales bacterium]|nr:TIM barrel protein [Opitutales bacterium]
MDSVKPIISLSTCMLQSRFQDDGYAMLCYAAEMGFEYVELGHSTTITSMEGILKAVEEGIVKVSSLHNFCPVPPFASGAVPNLFSPSTKSKIESELWRKHTLNTLEFAKQTNAKAIVAHSGRLSYFLFEPEKRVVNFTDKFIPAELAENEKYLQEVKKFVDKSSKRAFKKDYKNLISNLQSIEENLKESNVVIGVENREGTAELPLDWDFKQLFENFNESEFIKVWHDVGHSKIKDLKKLYSQQQLIENTLPNIVGWHLHDCSDTCKDHVAIGKGDINFDVLKQYFNPQKHIFTLELNYKVKTADAKDSLKRVQDLLA